MGRIAILVSAKIDAKATNPAGRGHHPRRDYFELARSLDAAIVNHEQVVSRMWRGRSKTALGPAFAQALHAFRRRHEYDTILCDSEHVGLPLALLFKLARVRKGLAMIAHRLSTPKKALFFRALKVHSHLDRIICYSSHQSSYAVASLGIPPERVEVVLHGADHRFWQPMPVVRERLIAAAGLEYRDYPTLIEAVRTIDVSLRIAAASPWSRRRDETRDVNLPSNVTVVSHSPLELRQLYASSLFVVVPLYDTEFQAGTLVTYEAMAMARAVIASRTTGHGDALRDGLTGLYVEPGNVEALRGAVCRLLQNRREAEEMGRRARAIVQAGLNLDTYVADVTRIVQEVDKLRNGAPMEHHGVTENTETVTSGPCFRGELIGGTDG